MVSHSCNLHNNTAITKLPQHSRKNLFNNRLNIILFALLLPLLLTILLSLLLTGVTTTTAIVRLLLLVMRRMLLLVLWIRRHLSRTTRQINIDSARVLFRGILKPQFATDLFNTRFDFLHVVNGMVAFSDDPIPLSTTLQAAACRRQWGTYTCRCVCPC